MTDTTEGQLEQTLTAAAGQARRIGDTSPAERAALLRACAVALEASAAELIELAGDESNLPAARLTGELARTTFQLRSFADQVADGSCFDAVIEHADPDDALGHRVDLRRVSLAVGPVLVFAASNFPFAFSVAGGDTAAALAAGCPVIVKAHHGHPQLSERVGQILRDAGAPVSVITGEDAGRAALVDPRIRAAAFTGSTTGGRALFDLASGRADPIPFYGELGSVNPTFVSPAAARQRGQEIVGGFVASFTLGAGQFCTKPGLLFLPEGHGLGDELRQAVEAVVPAPMLGPWIEERYRTVLAARRSHADVDTVVATEGAVLLSTSVQTLLEDVSLLQEEVFGPASVVVDYGDLDALVALAGAIEGTLTATIHAQPDETDWAQRMIAVLTPRTGRVVFNGWPTGVAVSPAMHHGGPWPSTTAPLHSSVGGNAISRFLHPVSFQGVPDDLLPAALREANPYGIHRRTDGALR